jgi:hypothetical protein
MKTLFTIIISLLVYTGAAQAQSVKTAISSLSFMAGKWTLKHQWGDMEEYWGSPMGNNMMCSYRCVKDGKAVFYEFIVIEQSNGSPVMKLRHFNPGSIAWEEKDRPYLLYLTSINRSKAVFTSADKKVKLGYERLSKTKLLSWLEEVNKKGKLEKEVFAYSLQP